MTRGPGHVFVIHGNLLDLACDAVLVPTDCWKVVENYWKRWQLSDDKLPPFGNPPDRVTDKVVVRGQRIRYVDVGRDPDHADLDWLQAGIRAGLRAAVMDFEEDPTALHDRERPLVAMPLLGVGEGGYNEKRGQALAILLEETHAATRSGLDVAIVCLHRSDYAALQSRRWRGRQEASQLSPELKNSADSLGRKAKGGELALFLGAGVSQAAGLPSWEKLLRKMAPPELASSKEFKRLTKRNPALAGTRLKEALGDRFEDELVVALSTKRYAVTHGLLASLRIGEVLTTNIDQLYERAAKTPLGKLSVLPWRRMPGRPPWLLKMHGDLGKMQDLVITREDYADYDKHHGPLGAVVQALLITRHLVFIGYSLRDKNFVKLANEVAATLDRSDAKHKGIGTVLALTDASEDEATQWENSFEILPVGDDDPEITNVDTRLLEIFLDRVVWRAAEDEWSWILDDRYEELMDQGDQNFAAVLKGLEIPGSAKWEGLRAALSDYGLKR